MSLYIGIVLLSVMAIAIVLFPLFRRATYKQAHTELLNVTIFKEQAAELERQREQQQITAAHFERQKYELELQLLMDSQGEQHQVTRTAGLDKQSQSFSLLMLLSVALLLCITAVAAYKKLGSEVDLNIFYKMQSLAEAKQGSERRNRLSTELLALLEQGLENQPEDSNKLVVYAQLAVQNKNYDDAVSSYQLLVKQFPNDADIAAQLAQTLFLAAGKVVTPEARATAEHALTINPRQKTVLSLLGFDAYGRGKFADAQRYWTRLLALIDPMSADAKFLNQALAKVKTAAGENVNSKVSALASIKVSISVAEGVDLPMDGLVFVYAKAVAGPPMPLAVQRLRVKDLPTTVALNDSLAMMPSLKLSNFERVQVYARYAASGTVSRSADDVASNSLEATVGDSVRLIIGG